MRIRATIDGARPRRVAGAALITAFGLAVSACAGGGSTSTVASTVSSTPLSTVTGPVTITFQEVYGSKSQLATLTKVVDAFEKANPYITVQLQASSNYSALFEKENAEVTAGNTPTIGMAYESYAQTWSAAQKIVPIKDLAGTNSPSEYSTFYTGVQNDLKLSDGDIWMWPLGKSLQLQAINQTQFTAAGITAAPTTWDQWATDLEAVTAKEKAANAKYAGITVYPQGSGETLFEEIAATDGQQLYAADGTPQFTSAAAVKALKFLQTEKSKGAIAVGGSTTDLYPGEDALTGGTGAEDITSSAGVTYEETPKGDTLEFAALPGDSMMAGANLVVYTSATTQQRAAAWELLQYLASASVQATWSEGIGYYPVTSQALTDMDASYLSANPWIQQTIGNLNTAFVDPPFGWATDCQTDLETAVSSALSGSDAASALQTAQSDCASKKSAES
ncbi:extracellular solute-binding protein [Actinospica durhamensis]|uniref:Extracellular solute-binding protein n=1 Tax=Actinospica durhamensis TaxID=1508375 RepID=A0A941ETM1_9ACTN|nr:extracellular solute-binding protein [Actinospica durhamensis]MBR7833644.1 extracellular solute-binding protein [Actinospica durhamensis]